MKLPLRAWKEVLATLGLSRRDARAKPKKGASRARVLRMEPLEDRHLLTTLTWIGGSSEWNTSSSNWSNGTSDVTWTNGDTAKFTGTGQTITIEGGVAFSAAEIDFTGNGNTIAAGTDGSLAVTGSGTIDVAPGKSAIISAPLVGTDGLTLDDTGTLQLAAANDFTGATVIEGGTLQLNNSLALRSSTSVSALPTGTLDLYGQAIGSAVPLDDFAGTLTNTDTGVPASFGATINETTQDNFTVSGTGDITLSAAVYGSATTTLSKNGSNSLTLADSSEFDGLSLFIAKEAGPVIQDGSATYTTLTIGAGTTLTIAPSGTPSPATSLYWDPNGTLSATGGAARTGTWNTTSDDWYNPSTGEDQAWSNSDNDTAIFAGTHGTVTLDTAVSADVVSFQSDQYVLASSSDGDTLTASGDGFSVDAGMTAEVDAPIAGSTGLIKIGTGNLILGGANDFSGQVAILYGTLTLANDGALGEGNTLSSKPNTTFDLNGQSIDSSDSLLFFQGTLINSDTTTGATFAGPVNYDSVFPVAPSFTVAGAGDITLSGAVDEYGSTLTVNMTGTNTLTLSGSDNNDGLNLVANSGTVELDKSSSSSIHAIEDGLTLDGGTVEFSGSGEHQIDDSAQVGIGYGGGTLDMNGTDQTIGSLGGDGDLSITGSGTLTIVGTSSNIGTTTIGSDATLLAGAAGALSPTSDFVVNGTLDLYGSDQTIGSLSGSGTVTNSASTTSILTVGADGNYTDFSGSLADDTGALGLTVIGGQLTLIAANSYTGGTILNGGGLQFGDGTSGNDGSIAGNITDDGALTFDYHSNEDFYGVITGAGSVSDIGAGIVTLDATSAYYGTTTIDAYATLKAGVANAFSADSDYTVSSNGTLDLYGSDQTIGSLSGGGTVKSSTSGTSTLTTQADGNSTLFSGLIENDAGTVALTIAGSGELVLTNSDTFTGAATIGSNAVLQLGDGETANGSVGGGITDDGTLVFANFESQTFSELISGSGIGGVIVGGLETLTLTAESTYSGPTTIVAGSTLAAGATNAFSQYSDYTVDASGETEGVLDLAGYDQTIGSLSGGGAVTNLASGTYVLTTGEDSASTKFDGVLEDGGSGKILSLTLAGGTLKLTGSANSYSGATTVDAAATLQAGSADAFSDNSAVTVNSTGILDLNSFSEAVPSIGGSGTVENAKAGTSSYLTVGNSGSNESFAGTIEDGSGVLGVIKVGTNTLTFSGTANYSGGTTIVDGVVDGAPSDIAPKDVESGSPWDLEGEKWTVSSLTGSGTISNSVSGTTAVLTILNSSADTFSGTIEGNIELVFAGSAAFTFSGSTNSYSASTIIDAGATLKAGVDDTFSANSDYVVNADGTLDLAGYDEEIGSLAGGGFVTNSGTGTNILTTGEDNHPTTFTGTLENDGAGHLALTQAGTAILTLAGTDSYTGTTTIDTGSKLTLQLGAGTLAGDIIDSGALTFANPNDQTYSGDISGSGTVTIDCTAILTLTGSNSNSGTTTVTTGTLQAGGTDVFSDSCDYVVNDTLDLGGYDESIASLSGTGEVTNNSSTDEPGVLTVSADSAGTEFEGLLMDGSGTLGLTVTTSGDTLKLGGYSAYSGASTVGSGATLQATESGSFSPESGFAVSGTLDLNGNSEQIAALTGSGTVENSAVGTASFLTVGDNGSADTFSGTIEDGGGGLGLVKVGTNTLTLSGTRTYSDGTTIDGGSVSGPASAPESESVTTTFDLAGVNRTLVSLTGGGVVENTGSGTVVLTLVNTSTDTFTGTIEGNIELIVAGTGTLIITGDNSYTGGTNIDGGTLQMGDGTSGHDGSIEDDVTDDGTLIFDYHSSETFPNVVTGWGGVTLESPVIVTMSAASSYYGTTTIDTGATLKASIADGFSDNSDYTIDGTGTLDLNGNSQAIGSLAGSGTVKSTGSAATLTGGDDDNSTEFNGTLEDGTGTLALTVSGTGMLTLGGTSSYSGATTIDADATLQGGAADALSDNSDFTVDSTGTLDLNGFNETVGSLAGGGTVTNNAFGTASFLTVDGDGNSKTFSGTIEDGSGVVGLIKVDSDTLTLSGTLSYSAGTDIIAGSIGGVTRPPAPDSSYLTSGESLDLDGHNVTLASLTGVGKVYNSVAGSTAVLTILNTSADTFDGTIEDGSGIVALAVAGSATLTLGGANTYSGPTIITGDSLKAGVTDALSDNSDYVVGTTLDLASYSQSIGSLSGGGDVTDSVSGSHVILTVGADGASSVFDGSLDNGSGSLGLTVTGAGGFTLTGSDSYSGTTTINGGSLQLGDGETTNGLVSSNIIDDGTLFFANTSDETYAGVISGSGSVTVDAASTATLTVSANSTYSGATTLVSGTLKADGDDVLSIYSTYEIDGTLDLDGTCESIGSLSGSGTITNSVSAMTAILNAGADNTSTAFSGVLENGGDTAILGLDKTGDGVLTLEGASTYTGPTTVGGGTIELSGNNHQILNAPPSGYAAGNVPADLGAAFNWTGITTDDDAFSGIPAMQSGGIDGDNHAISATELEATRTIDGVPFNFGPSEASDVVVADGQDVDLPQAEFSAIDILATSINGSHAGLTFVVNYSDGTTALFTQGVSDWTASPGYSGESTAFTMSYVNTSSGGTHSNTYYVYEYSFAIDPTKTVVSITLPDNENVMLLAATGIAPAETTTSLSATPTSSNDIELTWTAPSGSVSGYYVYRSQTSGGESTALNSTELSDSATNYIDTTAVPGNTYYYTVKAKDGSTFEPSSNEASAATPTAGSTTEVDLNSSFNFTGIVSDTSTFSSTGGLDGAGDALSATVLAAAPSWNSIPFIYGAAGGDNVVQATGQTITLPAGQFSQLEILATAVSTDQDSQIFTVNYADGTSQTFSQTISKWTDSGTAAISGEEDTYGGGEGSTVRVWGYTFNLNSAETVISISLPDNADVFIVSMTLHEANILPTGTAVNIADGALLELNGTDQEIASLSGAAGSYVDLGGATLKVSGSGTTTFAGTIYGMGGLTYSGSGTLILSGADTHTGTTVVSSGFLQAGAVDAFSASSTYIITGSGHLEVAGSQTIGSLSGDGTVTGSGLLTLGGDGTCTEFSGTIVDGDGPLGLNKTGDGTLVLSGSNAYTGPTTIGAGTLEVDDNVNNSPVTIDSGATLTGDGGTGPVTNLGGTYDPTLYKVTITDQYLQGEYGTVSYGVSLSTDDGLSEVVAALSPAAAAERVLHLTGTKDTFAFESSFSDGSYSGQAFVDESADPAYVTISDSFGGDYFPLCVTEDDTDPTAAVDSYKVGVGGTQTLDVLANDTDPADDSLSISNYTSPADGTLTLIDSGTEFTYTPNTGFFGTDSFTYVDSDGTHQSDSATVTIQVLLPTITLANTGTNPVLVSDDSVSPSSNADSSHLDELQLAVDPDSVFASLPYDLTGWKLNLDATNAGGSVEFWDSLGKSTELDSSGTGDETWTFGSTISSGSIPANLFADANLAAVDLLLLAWQQPSGSATNSTPLPTQSSSLTGQAGALIADTVSTSDVKFGAASSAMITGALPHGQEAYVPLSNESQVYNSEDTTGTPTQDKDYSGEILNDKFLLPVQVTGPAGTTYALASSGGGLSIWQTANRAEPASEVTVDGSGSATIYVEGDQEGQWTLDLEVEDQIKPVDQLTINVFSFAGPQDVPGGSIYTYSIADDLPTISSAWTVQQGKVVGKSISTVSIQWGNGGPNGIGQASFELNSNYTWSYYTNIVQITVTNVQPTSFPAEANAGSSAAVVPPGQVAVGANFEPGVKLTSNPDPLQRTFGERSRAAITMSGPNGNSGVDQIVVGFVQLIQSSFLIGVYKGLDELENGLDLIKKPMLDGQIDASDASPFYYVQRTNLPVSNQLVENRPDDVAGNPLTITDVDTPVASFPAYFNYFMDKETLPLTTVLINFTFQLDVAAGTKNGPHSDEPGAVTGGLSTTVVAQHLWSWDGSGSFDSTFNYTADADAGVTNTGNWTTVAVGSQFVDPTKLIFAPVIYNEALYVPNPFGPLSTSIE